MLKAGDVAVLKSGGEPLTVVEVRGEEAVCVWMGEEGDLFRETLPLLALDLLEEEDDEDAEDEQDEDTGEQDDEDKAA